MSGYSFSHQFYQRWIQAPDQVRGAIVQELKDIMTLLQTDTTVSEFTFTQPDLDAHLDELYAQDEAEKAKIAEQQRVAQEEERLKQEALEQQRAEKARSEAEEKARQDQARDDKERKEREVARAEKEKLAIAKAEAEKQATDQAESVRQQAADADAKLLESDHAEDKTPPQATPQTATATLTVPTNPLQQGLGNEGSEKDADVEKDTDPTHQGIADSAHQNPVATDKVPAKVSVPEAQLSETTLIGNDQEAFIHELETRIDDYLSEQMAEMSENLKAWVREEVKRQIERSQQS